MFIRCRLSEQGTSPNCTGGDRGVSVFISISYFYMLSAGAGADFSFCFSDCKLSVLIQMMLTMEWQMYFGEHFSMKVLEVSTKGFSPIF